MTATKIDAALVTCAALLIGVPAYGQEPARYRVNVDEPATRLYHVTADLPAPRDTAFISLPAWTPGHYTIENYARYVRDFRATDPRTGAPLYWDKLDKDTWRVVGGTGRVQVSFDYHADTLGLSLSLLRDDFGFFNGTNLFPYADGEYDRPAIVSFELPAGWRVATELESDGSGTVYRARDYHELVDNPTFVGRFAIDSVRADGRWVRLAVYPARLFTDPARRMALDALRRIADHQHDLFGEPPYDRYTVLVYLETAGIQWAGGLEHAESHLDVLPAAAFEQPRQFFPPFIYRLFAHEYYHAWNVKRIRPAALWPYAYDREQYTPLLWVSEGITDYYAHLTLVRTGLWPEAPFWAAVGQWIASVEGLPEPEAVEDASVSAWIDPTHLPQNYYYDKGALLGLLLDIRIRSATENRRSLDALMRRLYEEHFLNGRGFSTEDLFDYVAEDIGREEAGRFYRAHVDGRESPAYETVLAKAGLRFRADTVVEPFLGVAITGPAPGEIGEVVPGSAAAEAGLLPGDILRRVGSIEIAGSWGPAFRRIYADSAGASIGLVYERDGQTRTGTMTVRTRSRRAYSVGPDPAAGPAPVAVRRALLTGAAGSTEP